MNRCYICYSVLFNSAFLYSGFKLFLLFYIKRYTVTFFLKDVAIDFGYTHLTFLEPAISKVSSEFFAK